LEAIVAEPKDIVYTPPQVGTLVLSAVEERKANPGAGVRMHLSVIDEMLLPLRPGELVTVMGRPSNYKSGLMQYWARQVAGEILKEARNGEMVVYVTWEMAVEEIGLYDLAASTSLNAAEISQGRVTDAAWERLQAAAMKRASLPLWILGHSIERRKKRPRLTMGNIDAALRWVEDEMHDHPRIVFLDYLQQMESDGGESRRMQVFENVYRCKDLALALGCPVVLGVQAHRDVDNRQWKLPSLGDGLECISGDMRIMDAESGEVRCVRDWLGKPLVVHTLDGDWKVSKASAVVSEAATQPIYSIAFDNGVRIKVSGNHPILTSDGWIRADMLRNGHYVASVKHMSVQTDGDISADLALLLGLMLGDGCHIRTCPFFTNSDDGLISLADRIVREQFGMATHRRQHNGSCHLYMTGPNNRGPGLNPLIVWLREVGIMGVRHNDAFVPDIVFRADDNAVGRFLSGLFVTDGSIYTTKQGQVVIVFSSASEGLAHDAYLLLLRLGIPSAIQRITRRYKATRDLFHVRITGTRHVRRFMAMVGFGCGNVKADKAAEILAATADRRESGARLDRFPPSINEELIDATISARIGRAKHNMVHGRGVSRERLAKVSRLAGNDRLRMLADGDVGWCRVVAIDV
jgi:replicative DNA helicase